MTDNTTTPEPQLTPEQELGIDFELTPDQREEYVNIKRENAKRIRDIQRDYEQHLKDEHRHQSKGLHVWKQSVIHEHNQSDEAQS